MYCVVCAYNSLTYLLLRLPFWSCFQNQTKRMALVARRSVVMVINMVVMTMTMRRSGAAIMGARFLPPGLRLSMSVLVPLWALLL